MRVLALASQKGGSGKTTLSGHLAVQAQRAGAGPVVLIDIDPQGSLADWWNEREAEYPAFAQTTVARLASDLQVLRQQGFKLAVIDTPPAITDWIAMVMAGGVSITASLKPCWRRIARSLARRATVVWAKAGKSSSRSFHQSASEPCGSMSISTTGPAPARCAWTARWPDSVVFPEPPFCDANASTRKACPL